MRGSPASPLCRVAAAAVIALSGVLAPACASAPPPPRVHPYRVLLLPVEGAPSALDVVAEEGSVRVSMTPEELAARIRDSIVASDLFSSVVVASEDDLLAGGHGGSSEAVEEAAEAAAADLILRIRVRSARMSEIGANDSTIWSTVSWTAIPLPTWFVDDRSYSTDIGVLADLLTPGELDRPTASVAASSGRVELDLWDRGPSVLVAIVPPPFLPGDPEKVSEALTERAVVEMCADLLEQLRNLEIPARFDLSVSWDGRTAEVLAVSRRRLRSVEVYVGGTLIDSWEETRLLPDEGSTDDRFVYRRRAESTVRSDVVRVLVEDEVGGREVRTVAAPGSR